MTPRAGDHVRHKPSGEDWVVAYVDGDQLAWCGWPPGEANLSDCEIIKQATDAEHIELLERLAKSSDSRFVRRATEALDALRNPSP